MMWGHILLIPMELLTERDGLEAEIMLLSEQGKKSLRM